MYKRQAELTPDELSRLSKAQKREMYAAHAARSAVHREVDQYEDENVGVQALSEGEKAAGNVRDISKSRYARKLKKKAKMQGKKGTKTAKSVSYTHLDVYKRQGRHYPDSPAERSVRLRTAGGGCRPVHTIIRKAIVTISHREGEADERDFIVSWRCV